MSDEQKPGSGSRWEPEPDDATVAQPTTPPVPPAAADPEVQQAAPAPTPVSASAPAKRTWTERVRGNGGLVGAALALVLFSGVGGFAIGHATAGHDRFGLVGERFPGGPGGAFPGADGQLPPPRHDDDNDGFGTPPGSDDDGGGTENESGSTL